MENKKILKILVNDLSELEELVSEKNSSTFDELEMEFLHSRIKGAKKLVQLLSERENKNIREKKIPEKAEKIIVQEQIIENKIPEKPVNVLEKETVEQVEKEVMPENLAKIETEEEVVVEEKNEISAPKVLVEEEPKKMDEPITHKNELVEVAEEKKADKRLGDTFSKEKSVNDLINTESNNLEHKLSNRPVNSIQSSIGINDRFQYTRELFEGNAANFSKAVAELDAMKNINEAVQYLQENFNWKKNEVSLKFVNLVKRRFPNE